MPSWQEAGGRSRRQEQEAGGRRQEQEQEAGRSLLHSLGFRTLPPSAVVLPSAPASSRLFLPSAAASCRLAYNTFRNATKSAFSAEVRFNSSTRLKNSTVS